MYTDAHIHLYDCARASPAQESAFPASEGMSGAGSPEEYPFDEAVRVCASAHDREEFIWQERVALRHPGCVALSFGIHPQLPDPGILPFLEELLAQRRVAAVGECGFDLYTQEFRSSLDAQKKVWDAQLSLAVEARVPLVIHCRKALHLVFADTARLSRLPAVVFHGWPGSLREAESFLDRGLNAFFCAGKSLLRGDRSLRETVRGLPEGRLLTETDAPYMRLKGERVTVGGDIRAVAAETASVRGACLESLNASVSASFSSVFAAMPGQP